MYTQELLIALRGIMGVSRASQEKRGLLFNLGASIPFGTLDFDEPSLPICGLVRQRWETSIPTPTPSAEDY